MAKRRKGYKKVFKGTQYIAKKLVKHYPKRYKNYRDALPRAREIVSQLNAQKIKITWGSAKVLEVEKTREIYPNRYKKKDKKPLLSPLLSNPFETYSRDEIIDGIEDSSNELHFVADFLEEDVVGGSEPDYYLNFAPMVAFVDNYRVEFLGGINSPSICFINFTKPTFNKFSKRYESRIYITDPNGEVLSVDITDFGSQASEDDILGFVSDKSKGITKKEKSTVKSKEIKSSDVKLTGKQQVAIEKEKTKQKALDVMKQLMDSGMSPKEAQKMLKDMGLI